MMQTDGRGSPKVVDVYLENNDTMALSWEESITIETVAAACCLCMLLVVHMLQLVASTQPIAFTHAVQYHVDELWQYEVCKLCKPLLQPRMLAAAGTASIWHRVFRVIRAYVPCYLSLTRVACMQTGMYILWFVACDKELQEVTVQGRTIWKNLTGSYWLCLEQCVACPCLLFIVCCSILGTIQSMMRALWRYDCWQA